MSQVHETRCPLEQAHWALRVQIERTASSRIYVGADGQHVCNIYGGVCLSGRIGDIQGRLGSPTWAVVGTHMAVL